MYVIWRVRATGNGFKEEMYKMNDFKNPQEEQDLNEVGNDGG